MRFLSVLILLCLSSCSTYYYSTLESKDKNATKNEFGNFIIETDSVIINYNFYGKNAPITISVFNKLEEPLFIDWQRSFLIIGNKTNIYYNKKHFAVSDLDYFSGNYNWATLSGDLSLPEGVSFISPKSETNVTLLNLKKGAIKKSSGETFYKQIEKTNSKTITAKAKKYSENNSPLQFTSHLTVFCLGENNTEYKNIYRNNFYISELVKTGKVKPSDYKAYQIELGNFFYTQKINGAQLGSAMLAIVVGLITLLSHVEE